MESRAALIFFALYILTVQATNFRTTLDPAVIAIFYCSTCLTNAKNVWFVLLFHFFKQVFCDSVARTTCTFLGKVLSSLATALELLAIKTAADCGPNFLKVEHNC